MTDLEVAYESVQPNKRSDHNSYLRVYGQLGFGGIRKEPVRIEVKIDHYYAFQGHAVLSRWTSVGWQEFVSFLCPESDYTAEGLRQLQWALIEAALLLVR